MQAKTDAQRDPTLQLLARDTTAGPHLDNAPQLLADGCTSVGKVRRNNEDQFLVAEVDRAVRVDSSSFDVEGGTLWPVRRQAQVLMVADGIGGHAHGEIASAVAIDAILGAVATMRDVAADDEEAFIRELEAAVAWAQARVLGVARRKGLHFKPGTTLTMAYVDWPSMYVVHAGDSRCYLHREGELRQLTLDHTLAARLVEAGLPPEQAERSRSRHVLVNAVGGGTPDLQVDLQRLSLRRGDRVLLCTDGLYDLVPMDRIASLVGGQGLPRDCAASLVDAALGAGGTDNVTAVVMHVLHGPDSC